MRTLREMSDRYEVEGLQQGLNFVDSDVSLDKDRYDASQLEDFVSLQYPEDGDIFTVTDLFGFFLEVLSGWLEVDESALDEIRRGDITFGEFDFTGFPTYENSKETIEQIQSIERYLLKHEVAEVIFIEAN